MRTLLLAPLTLFLLAGPAAADDETVGYALVVGSNAPGPGQAALAWAEDDAREVADLLREIGDYDAGHVRVLLRPSPDRLLGAVAELERAVARDVAAGRHPRLFFYYSGHAKASGLSLGSDELPLIELRSRLMAIPASLTVVVLDACQSGAFSRAKGAEPAADFSFNSRSRLDAAGIAVVASSTGSELSQESDFLRSSYFTHHLLVGLRGAADDNRDGRVSLDEIYRYTYHQTLATTAETAVGSQHVSIEVDLKGQGEIPLSYPEKASTTITVPAPAEGQVLVARLPRRAVVAEVHKARGTALAVAVAPGRYQVLIRSTDRLLRCEAAPGAAPVTLALDGCESEALIPTSAKGGVPGVPWSAAVVVGLGGARDDGYIDRLNDFGYSRQNLASPQVGVDVLRRIHRHVLVGGQLGMLGGEQWRRGTDFEPLTIRWTTYTAAGVARAEIGTRRVLAYAQLGAGLALATSHFSDQVGAESNDTYPGVFGIAAIGTDVYFTRRWGMTVRLSASVAPTLDNLIGDQHDTGLVSVGLGVVSRR